MNRLILFGIISLPVIMISWRTLFNLKSHGFYRFFSWECIVWLLVSNYKFWFYNAFSLNQIISWTLLVISGYLVIAGAIRMKKIGKPGKNRESKSLYPFEMTTELIDQGIFKYIRHPLYSSLLFLTWGIYLKQPTYILIIVALFSSGFLYLTAIFDEKESIRTFGNAYREYMKQSKRFIPYVI